jgi:adenylate kinase
LSSFVVFKKENKNQYASKNQCFLLKNFLSHSIIYLEESIILEIILLTGIPGTGKTAIAKIMEKKYHWINCSLGEIVVQKNLFLEEDQNRDTKVIDEVALCRYLDSYLSSLNGTVLIESHYVDIVERPEITMGFILRCHPHILEQRLRQRGYSESKIRENIQAEILGDCTSYMLEKKKFQEPFCLFEINTSQQSLEQTSTLIYNIYQNRKDYTKFKAGILSWMSDPTVEIERFLD